MDCIFHLQVWHACVWVRRFTYVLLNIQVCVCACVYEGVLCIWKRELDVGCLPWSCSTLWRQGFLLNLELSTWLVYLVSLPWVILSAGITGRHHAYLTCGCQGYELSLFLCHSTLFFEPSPKPY